MKPVFTKKITVIILSFSLALLVAGTFITYFDIKNLISTNASVVQIHRTVEQLNDVVLDMIAMRDEAFEYLEQPTVKHYQLYLNAKNQSLSNLQTLRVLLAENLQQQEPLANLLPVYSTFIKKLDFMLTQQQQGQLLNQLVAINEIKARMLKAQQITDAMSNMEFAKLSQHNAYITHSSQQINLTFLTVGFLSNFLLLLCFLLLNHQEKQHYQALAIKNRDLALSNVRLQEINRLKGEFLANMSHELRTPLNAVIGFTQLIANQDAGPINAEQQELSNLVLSNSQELLALINRILDLAKIESGVIELNAQAVQLEQTITGVMQSFEKMAAPRQIKIVKNIQDIQTIFIDPVRFKQILTNYLSNAIKFSHDNSEVSIEVSMADAGFFKLAVKDKGIGIKEKDLDKLYVQFQQIDGSASKAYGGVGMGLALTKKIADAMGGRVGVESQLNQGSVFYTILPINQID